MGTDVLTRLEMMLEHPPTYRPPCALIVGETNSGKTRLAREFQRLHRPVVVKDDATDPMNYFRDISTFGGCTADPTAGIENMRIIEDEGLLENCTAMGARMRSNLEALMEKHEVIGDVRGKGLFMGAELVKDRETKEPADETKVQAVLAECGAQGVIIGATNRSVPGRNNTLCFSPALIATEADIDAITAAVDVALTRVFG